LVVSVIGSFKKQRPYQAKAARLGPNRSQDSHEIHLVAEMDGKRMPDHASEEVKPHIFA
jgi:hypothetical protein